MDFDLGLLGFSEDELAKLLDPGVKDPFPKDLCPPSPIIRRNHDLARKLAEGEVPTNMDSKEYPSQFFSLNFSGDTDRTPVFPGKKGVLSPPPGEIGANTAFGRWTKMLSEFFGPDRDNHHRNHLGSNCAWEIATVSTPHASQAAYLHIQRNWSAVGEWLSTLRIADPGGVRVKKRRRGSPCRFCSSWSPPRSVSAPIPPKCSRPSGDRFAFHTPPHPEATG